MCGNGKVEKGEQCDGEKWCSRMCEAKCSIGEEWDETAGECKAAPKCPEGEVIDPESGMCMDKKEFECKAIGMEKYINPNDPNDITCARINNFPYINQALNSSGGGYKTPAAGTVMCGANSVIMAASGMGQIPYNNFDDLKTYTYNDNGVTPTTPPAYRHCDWVNDVFNGNHMYNVGGSWSFVGNDWQDQYLSECAASVWPYMKAYLDGFFLNTKYYDGDMVPALGQEGYMNYIKTAVDEGGGAIQGLSGVISSSGYYEHIILIKGYTDDDKDGKPDRVIVNDPWTNIMLDTADYSLKGNGAIYKYQYTKIINFASLITLE